MPTFFVDETGFTGEDLLAENQPLFAQASVDYSDNEAQEIIGDVFADVQAQELKHSRLARNERHQTRIVELIRILAQGPDRLSVWTAHKEYALLTLVIDNWVEPLANQTGLNLYKDGANLGMANMMFYCLQGFWSAEFRQRLLLRFQRMFRSRSPERFGQCQRFVNAAYQQSNENQYDIIRYLWPSFELLGHRHVVALPKHVLDLSIPGLAYIGHSWRQKSEGPWEVVYDQSSMVARQQWIWDALSSPDIPKREFVHPSGIATFPMNVAKTRFGDSAQELQLQICDLLAGATVSFLKLTKLSGETNNYARALEAAGVEDLITGGLWPSTDVTPEQLGMQGWDGNEALEWLGEQMPKRTEN